MSSICTWQQSVHASKMAEAWCIVQLHWPDRYVPVFGAGPYDPENERPDDVPFEEQLHGLESVIKAGKVASCTALASTIIFQLTIAI